MVVAHDQPLEEVLRRAARILNASLVRVGAQEGVPTYQIEQLPAQLRAEAEVADGPWLEMVRTIEALAAGTPDPGMKAGEQTPTARLREKYPGWVEVIRRLPRQGLERLAAGEAVSSIQRPFPRRRSRTSGPSSRRSWLAQTLSGRVEFLSEIRSWIASYSARAKAEDILLTCGSRSGFGERAGSG
jgi:hypothetical protein